MRLVLAILSACLLAQAQIPAQDVRNTYVPNTDTHLRVKTYQTLDEWNARREVLRKQILSASGLLPLPPKNDLRPQIFGRIENRDCTIEKVLLETLPGYYLGGNLYRPLKPAPAGGYPAVLSPHGHWTYGRLEHTNLASVPGRAINLARQGYVVFAFDQVGYNDTMQAPHEFGEKPEERIWSFGPLGLQLWNGIRALDFIASLPGVDPKRIGATGASGGGTQTFLLQAVDDRIQFSAPANMISLIMQGGALCENAPGLRVNTNNVEIASLMAPKPMLMVSATGDWTKNNPTEEYPAIRAIYDLYGKPDNVANVHLDAPHNYNLENREAMYRFFGKHVLGDADASKFKEKAIRLESLPNMLALYNRKLPDNAISFQQLFDEWKRLSAAQSGNEKERLTYALGAEWPASVLTSMEGERIVLGRKGVGDRIPGIWIDGTKPAAVVVHPDGAAAARNTPEVAALLQAKRAVLLIDTFQTGTAKAPRDRSHKMFLTFNLSDDANRVQDILTALAWLNAPKTRLVGLGNAAVWCTFAAAVAKQPVDLQADLGSFTGTDKDFSDRFFVPGIQRAGGLKAAKLLLARP
jgi:hypothetical protein